MSDRFALGRLRKRPEFLYVRDGQYRAQGGVVVQVRENPAHKTIRVGYTATKKIGNAVIRNRVKRRLRALAQDILPRLGKTGHDYVLIARQSTVQRPFSDLHKDLEKALSKLN